MTYIAFDHHKKWTQAAAIDDQEKIIGYAVTGQVWSYAVISIFDLRGGSKPTDHLHTCPCSSFLLIQRAKFGWRNPMMCRSFVR
jgi:hypothetical protein